jgi:hypothetical protein
MDFKKLMEDEELIFVIGNDEVNRYPGDDLEWKYAKCLQLRTCSIKDYTFKIKEVYDVPNAKAFRLGLEPIVECPNWEE